MPLSNLSPVGAVFMLECGIDRAVLEKLRVHRPQGMAGVLGAENLDRVAHMKICHCLAAETI